MRRIVLVSGSHTTTLPHQRAAALPKAPTGIVGLDELTGGGLPKGRPTLLAGNAGCGKTLLAMEFLVRGATDYDEPGVFMTFEESTEDLTVNFASLGSNLDVLVSQENSRSSSCMSSVVKWKRRVNTTSNRFSSGLATRLTVSGQSAWCWTRSRRSSKA